MNPLDAMTPSEFQELFAVVKALGIPGGLTTSQIKAMARTWPSGVSLGVSHWRPDPETGGDQLETLTVGLSVGPWPASRDDSFHLADGVRIRRPSTNPERGGQWAWSFHVSQETVNAVFAASQGAPRPR